MNLKIQSIALFLKNSVKKIRKKMKFFHVYLFGRFLCFRFRFRFLFLLVFADKFNLLLRHHIPGKCVRQQAHVSALYYTYSRADSEYFWRPTPVSPIRSKNILRRKNNLVNFPRIIVHSPTNQPPPQKKFS